MYDFFIITLYLVQYIYLNMESIFIVINALKDRGQAIDGENIGPR